ncbi:MAG: hypothetical protein QM683_10775 [Lacrimispora sp.]
MSVETMSDDFSMAVSGIPSMVNETTWDSLWKPITVPVQQKVL